MKKNKLALNLSKTSIQLLRKGSKKNWYVLGSADPSSENLEKDLARLKNQAAALSSKKPTVDVLLPRELVLSQTIVIEDDSSVEYCKKVTAKRCGLNENDILIAIGDSSTKSTVPVAAISTNSINESRNFVKKAGFRPEKYIASSKISGFKKSPVFFNDRNSKKLFDLESETFTKVLTFASILLFVGFLASLVTVFLEYKSNNSPHNYLASSKSFLEKENRAKAKLLLLKKVNKIPLRQQLKTSNFQQKHANFAYVPPKPQNKYPKLNLQNRFPKNEQLRTSFNAIKIEELGLVEPVSPTSNPTNPKQFDDLKEVSNSLKQSIVSLYYNRPKETLRTLPKMEVNFSAASKPTKLVSQKSISVSNSLDPKRVLAFPMKERIVNHKYKKVLIEEVFSDISSTKILITTAKKRASTLPLLYFDIKRPDITNPNNFIPVNYINNEDSEFITTKNIKRNKQSIRDLMPIYSARLTLNRQFNLKLKGQGLKIKLLNSSQDNNAPLGLWIGKRPTIKPKIIDSIKVLDNPTRSTGAVTFVGLPPEIPLAVTKLKKVYASSIKNLNVRSNPPSIPKRSSIVGNSTQKNLIELNRTNLIGVFGKRTGRVALIRLSSGNTVKVKAGQQFGDGWRVISIDLDKIHVTNGSRQETLRIPG